jgi:hypothetical protein
MMPYRHILLPELEESTKNRMWRRVFYSIVLTSVEFFFAVVAVLTVIPVLLDPITLTLAAGSLVHLLPVWLVDLWAVQFFFGGVFTIWGIVGSDFRIEQIGVLFLMTGAFVYTVALVFLLPTSWIAFVTYVLFVLAMIARYWVLGRLIKLTGRLKKRLRTGSKGE